MAFIRTKRIEKFRKFLIPTLNVQKIINSMKDKINVINGTDEVSWQTCDKFYIGHTGMSVKRRMYFHKSNLKLNQRPTQRCRCLLRMNDTMFLRSACKVCIERNLVKRRILEGVYI